MDFVTSDTSHERLLLTLISKIDDNTFVLQKLQDGLRPPQGNPLVDFKPLVINTEEEEAHYIRRKLEEEMKYSRDFNIHMNHLYLLLSQ